jgi:hypothetical protein
MTAPDTNRAEENPADTGLPNGVSVAGTQPPADNSLSSAKLSAKAKEHNIRVSPAVLDAAAKDGDELLRFLHTAPEGLSQTEADSRARTVGPNEVAQEQSRGWFIRLLIILRNPLVILLAVLSSISYATGDMRAGTVMACMVLLSASLRFVQEARADAAAAKLKAMIHVTATVLRDGNAKEIPLRDLVPGDVVKLSAGDMIPGDVRLLATKDLFVSQGTLTGESLPVEKFHDPEPQPSSSPTELKNICFLGTSVQSGTATAVVVVTGVNTYLGSMAGSITEQEPPHQLRPRAQPLHLADDPVDGGDGAAGLPHQRLHQARLEERILLRDGGGRGPHAGDAAHDRLGLPGQGRDCNEPQEGDREAAERHPELRRHGRAVHRQDGYADRRPRGAATALQRGWTRDRRGAARWLPSSATSRRD